MFRNPHVSCVVYVCAPSPILPYVCVCVLAMHPFHLPASTYNIGGCAKHHHISQQRCVVVFCLVVCVCAALVPLHNPQLFYALDSHQVNDASINGSLPNLTSYIGCVSTFFNGSFELLPIYCDAPGTGNPLSADLADCSDALSNIESSNISSFDDIFFFPSIELNDQRGSSTHGATAALFTQTFVRPSKPASIILLDTASFFDNQPQEEVYLLAEAVGALRGILRRTSSASGPYPVLLIGGNLRCQDSDDLDVSGLANSTDLATAVGIIPDIRVSLSVFGLRATNNPDDNCGFVNEEVFNFTFTDPPFSDTAPCRAEDFNSSDSKPSGLYFNAFVIPYGTDNATSSSPAGYEAMGGLGYGLGVSANGLANVTTSDVVSCLSAADAGLGSFGTRSFVVVDCDTLTDTNFTTACMNALSELSGSGVILPPFVVFVRLVLHPETGEASVASQVISLLSLVGEIPLVGVVVRPVGYSPEGYIAPGYNLEPGLRAPGGVRGNVANFESLLVGVASAFSRISWRNANLQ